MMNAQDAFDKNKIRDYWLIEAEEALQVADHLVETKDPDEKRSFRKRASASFTQTHMAKIKEVTQWLRSLVQS